MFFNNNIIMGNNFSKMDSSASYEKVLFKAIFFVFKGIFKLFKLLFNLVKKLFDKSDKQKMIDK